MISPKKIVSPCTPPKPRKNIFIFLQGLKIGFSFSSFFFVFLALELFLYFCI